MNLTKRQVEALTSSIAEEVRKIRTIKREAIKASIKTSLTPQEKAKVLDDALKVKASIVLNKKLVDAKLASDYGIHDQILNKVVLASIDSTDLESLTKAILKDYK